MKFVEPVLPEILLSKRGLPQAMSFYKEALRAIKSEIIDGKAVVTLPPAYSPYLTEDTAEHLLVAKLFRDSGAKTYYLNDSFTRDLAYLSTDLPLAELPKNSVSYFILGSGRLCDLDSPVEGGLVYTGPGKNLGLCTEAGQPLEATVLSINYFSCSLVPGGVGQVLRMTCTLDDATKETLVRILNDDHTDSVEAMLTDAKIKYSSGDADTVAARVPVLRALINAAIYANSESPAACKLLPLSNYSNKKRAEVKKTVPARNMCLIPITLLNHGYGDVPENHPGFVLSWQHAQGGAVLKQELRQE